MKLITFVQEKLTEHLPANSLRRRFAKGAFWSVDAAVVSQGMRFLAFVVVTRILGKTGFGELGMIQHTVSMFGVFAGLGLGLTATKHFAQFRSADSAQTDHSVGSCGLVHQYFIMAQNGCFWGSKAFKTIVGTGLAC